VPLDFHNPETRRKIQYVFQDTFHALNPRMNISRAIMEPIAFHFGTTGQELIDKADEFLDLVGLPAQVKEKYPHELSGGQRQRVCIARALTVRPDLLIADEPVSSLDVSVQAQILKLFVELNESRGITILFITHDLRIVKSLADHVIVMSGGKIVENGTVESVYSAPESMYTKLLLSSIPNSPYKFEL
jgi:ABC-type glutathione transport system ATPase component